MSGKKEIKPFDLEKQSIDDKIIRGCMKSSKVTVRIEQMRDALLALGHQRIWLRVSPLSAVLITWNGLVVARWNTLSRSWVVLPAANEASTNPAAQEPDEPWIDELTDENGIELIRMGYPLYF